MKGCHPRLVQWRLEGEGAGAEKVEVVDGSLNNKEKREIFKHKATSQTKKYHATLASLF